MLKIRSVALFLSFFVAISPCMASAGFVPIPNVAEALKNRRAYLSGEEVAPQTYIDSEIRGYARQYVKSGKRCDDLGGKRFEKPFYRVPSGHFCKVANMEFWIDPRITDQSLAKRQAEIDVMIEKRNAAQD